MQSPVQSLSLVSLTTVMSPAMAGGFTFMYAGLIAVFSLLFLNLLVARFCGRRRTQVRASQELPAYNLRALR